MKTIYYASTSKEASKWEKEHSALARKIGAEGMVLLENDGVLPLKEKKLALYGVGARHTAFGGTGSGENNPRYTVTVEQGLVNAGLEITNTQWLDDYDHTYQEAYSVYRKELAEGMKKVSRMEQMDYATSHPFAPPTGGKIEKRCNTAVYVLTRQCGEGADRTETKGDWYITDAEKTELKAIAGCYEHVILLLNIGAMMDLSFLEEIRVSAILYMMQSGMETGNSVADILTGAVNPSGRLADTWGGQYRDYPSADTFSERNPEPLQEDYKEGIYVGYRWFDKNRIVPRYPFGYGLSYTTFETDYNGAKADTTVITVTASVTNSGNVPGKDVLQLYISVPERKLDREVKSLAAFAKTKLLVPGETENLTLSFDLRDFAGFDKESHSFILEQGDYVLTLNGKAVSILEINETVVTEQVKSICPLNRKIDFFVPEKQERKIPGLPRISVDVSSIKPMTHDYSAPAMVSTPEIDAIVAKLSEKDMAKLLVGSSYVGPFHHRVFGAGGYTTSVLLKKGIDGMAMSDGPQGLNLTQISKKPLQNLFAVPSLPSALRGNDVFSKMGGESAAESKKTMFYQFCTAWPCATLQAQTWNTELLRRQGDAIGREMVEFGVVYWLAPAMNIHRNPLCGRNYEYYSEDPVLSGEAAAALTEGVQSHPGCYVTLKHYCANNLETGRNQSSSNLDERTLREIYLKGFRIVIQKANAQGVMCSYNKINGVYSAMSHDLQTKVLRNEWGYKGVVMTDWFATGHHDSLDELSCNAGTDLIMPGMPGISGKIMKALKTGKITHADMERSARRIIRAALNSHTAKEA